jgi:hypothetical protein
MQKQNLNRDVLREKLVYRYVQALDEATWTVLPLFWIRPEDSGWIAY